MAENKKSFILYCDLIKIVEKIIIQDRQNNMFGHIYLQKGETDYYSNLF